MMSEHLKNPKTKLRMLRIDFKGWYHEHFYERPALVS
jgi:hypothetical protein